MAKLTLSRGKIIITFKDGKKITTGARVLKSMSSPKIKSIIGAAISKAKRGATLRQRRELIALMKKAASLAEQIKAKAPAKIARRRVRRRKPAKVVRAAGVTLIQISSVMSGRLSAKRKMSSARLKSAIERLAKNGTSLSKLVAKNPTKVADLIFKAFSGIDKFAGEYGYLQYKLAPKYPNILPEKPFADLNAAQKLFAIRSYLLETVPSGNPAFKKELAMIFGRTPAFFASAVINNKLDPETVLAAAAYLRRHFAEQVRAGAGPKIPLLKISAIKYEEPKIAVAKTPIVAAIGASTTGNVKAEELAKGTRKLPGRKIGYVLALEKRLRKISKGAIVDSYGVIGQSTTAILKRFRGNISTNNYNTVIILGGINDAYNRLPLETTTRNLGKMIEIAKKKKMHVILLTIFRHKFHGDPPKRVSDDLKRRFKAINDWIKQQKGVDIVRLDTLEPLNHLHPGMDKVAKFADQIYDQVFRKKIVQAQKGAKRPKGEKERARIRQAASMANLAGGARPASVIKTHKKIAESSGMVDYVAIQKMAVQGLFNTLKRHPHFKKFLQSDKYATTIGAADFTFITDEPHAYCGLAVESIIAFSNWKATNQVYKQTNLDKDIIALNKHLGRPPKKTLTPNKNSFLNALMAGSIFQWRLKNPKAEGGKWVETLQQKKVPAKGRRLIR
jgi:hypothetical protein